MTIRKMDLSADDVIRILQLEPLPVEGGYFRLTYTGGLQLPEVVLPADYSSERPVTSVIYFFLTGDTKSRLHRLVTDEMWHFYMGDAVELYVFGSDDDYTKWELGHDLKQGETVQAVVPANNWFGARLKAGGRWALMACSLAPAYSGEDFSLPDAAEFEALLARFPAGQEILHNLR